VVLEFEEDMTREPASIDSLVRHVLLLLAMFTWLRLPSDASQSASGSWPMVNLDSGATRYSPLTQITPANVGHLKVAWIYHMKPAPAAGSAPDNAWRPSKISPWSSETPCLS
jgi:quinoprotein glucose dehydrogenase